MDYKVGSILIWSRFWCASSRFIIRIYVMISFLLWVEYAIGKERRSYAHHYAQGALHNWTTPYKFLGL